MNGYWSVLPRQVVNSKNITGDELKLYAIISGSLTGFGWCPRSNEDFAKELGVDERTVSRRLASLAEKRFINIVLNRHKHRRQIYINVPGTPPLYDDIQIYSEGQKKFIEAFPDRMIDADVPEWLDIDLLIDCIKSSDFLSKAKNMSLKSCLERYPAIIAKGYAEYSNSKTSQFSTSREYDRAAINSIFQKIEDVEF